MEVADYNSSCGSTGTQLFWRPTNGCYDFRSYAASVSGAGMCPLHQHIFTGTYGSGDPNGDTGCYVARAVYVNGELGPPSDEICPAVDPLPTVDCGVGYTVGVGCPTKPTPVYTRVTRYFLNDHLGTPRTIARADGGPVVDEMQLGPFGENMDTPSCAQRRQFTGHERDDETGLDYMMARYYGREIGRFLTVDPLRNTVLANPQGWSAYEYVRNNPLRFTDPTGMYTASCGNGVKNCPATITLGHRRQLDLCILQGRLAAAG